MRDKRVERKSLLELVEEAHAAHIARRGMVGHPHARAKLQSNSKPGKTPSILIDRAFPKFLRSAFAHDQSERHRDGRQLARCNRRQPPHGLGYHGANVPENAFITYQGATG